MNPSAILERLQRRFGAKITGSNLEAIDPWIEVAVEALPEVCGYLRDDAELKFNFLHCISGVDYCEPDPKKAAKVEWQPHLEVLYHLSSLVHRHRLVVKVILPRWKDGVEGQLPEVPTVSGLWRTADWHEREVYDLSGVRFLGHPDFRRILCPEDWAGHPLRKDYQMPLEYHGIRGR
jgi:NADH-quinone oxidoreductase subunit C